MIPPAATRGRPAWLVPLLIVTILVWLPGLIFASGLITASILDCPVNEAFPQACMLWGRDIGGFLINAFVLGWVLIVTLPFMAITLLIWLGLGLRRLWPRRR